MGTTGIVFTIYDGSENSDIYSVVQTERSKIVVKVSSTLHIYQQNGKDLYEENTIMNRAYFGDKFQPEIVKQFISQHKDGTDYAFHGLKTVVYQNIQYISPINAPKLQFDSKKIFIIALRLLQNQIMLSRKTTENEYRLVFLVPANSNASLKDMLKEQILQVFTELGHKEDISRYLIMIHEPVAAVLYSIDQLKKSGTKLNHYQGDSSKIIIIDLGGGTCDFSLVNAKPNDISRSDITLNDAIFAGGFYIDYIFMQFIGIFFANSTPQFRIQALYQFMEKKKNYPFQQFEVDFPEGFCDEIDIDEFRDICNNDPITNIYDDDEIKDMYEQQQIHVTPSIYIMCFSEAIQKIKTKAKQFLTACAEKGPIDHIIFVGGLTESEYIFTELHKEIMAIYKDIKISFKFLNDIRINKIAQRSLAVIIGGKTLFQQIEGDLSELTKNHPIVANNDIFFLDGKERVQIFMKGQGTQQGNVIPQLTNLTPQHSKNDSITNIFEALIQFVSVEEQCGSIVDIPIDFLVDIKNGGPFSVRLSLEDGHQLIVHDSIKKQVTYQPFQKPNLYFLLDSTESMSNYAEVLIKSTEKILEIAQLSHCSCKFYGYSDYCYTQNKDSIDEWQNNENTLIEFLYSQYQRSIQKCNNDVTENILPAFEKVVAEKVHNKVIIIIGDCCAHTHIGCQCGEVKPIPEDAESRKVELERHYSCKKCMNNNNGIDFLLLHPEKVVDHRKRWQSVADNLQDSQIIFVPVQQYPPLQTKHIVQIDVKHKYRILEHSILKTHRMLFLMGCMNCQTVLEESVEKMVDNMLSQLKTAILQIVKKE